MSSVASKQAEILRQDGNTYFKKDRFAAAIEAYTEAITLCPHVPVYFSNRALCHLKRNDWKRVEEDCRRAVELDHHSVKGHYMLGLALLQRKEYAEGVKELEKDIRAVLVKAGECHDDGAWWLPVSVLNTCVSAKYFRITWQSYAIGVDVDWCFW